MGDLGVGKGPDRGIFKPDLRVDRPAVVDQIAVGIGNIVLYDMDIAVERSIGFYSLDLRYLYPFGEAPRDIEYGHLAPGAIRPCSVDGKGTDVLDIQQIVNIDSFYIHVRIRCGVPNADRASNTHVVDMDRFDIFDAESMFTIPEKLVIRLIRPDLQMDPFTEGFSFDLTGEGISMYDECDIVSVVDIMSAVQRIDSIRECAVGFLAYLASVLLDLHDSAGRIRRKKQYCKKCKSNNSHCYSSP